MRKFKAQCQTCGRWFYTRGTCRHCGEFVCPRCWSPELHGYFRGRNRPPFREPIGHQRNLPWKKAFGVLAVLVLIIVLGAGFYYGLTQQSSTASLQTTSQTTSTVSQTTPTTLESTSTSTTCSNGFWSWLFGKCSTNWLVDNPSFQNGSTKIDYPPDYSTLVNFTLQLINNDRASAGLSPVSLSTVPSGQQHSDSMAYFGYFSHWDVQGYKPYMRYTLLGGEGYVAENAGLDYCTDSSPSATLITPTSCNVQTIENGITNSEWGMMNNDQVCCNNGHRDNILNPLHNRVSIGIAYNTSTNTLYFVEDFEDSYVNSASLQFSGGVVTFQGSTQQNLAGWVGDSSGAAIEIYYDPTPTNISVNEVPQGAYDLGTQIATVLAPCPAGYICESGSNLIYAQTWQQNSGNFQIVFAISGLESTYGNGVYTLYLWPAGESEPITGLSIFVMGG